MRSEKKRRRASIRNVLILSLLLVLALAACERPLQDVAGDGELAPTDSAPQEAEETTAPPVEEEPTITAPTDVAPTDAPAAETPATEAAPIEAPEEGEDESPRTGDDQESEGDEATPGATIEPMEEGDEEETPEATAEPTEEATAEATPEGDDEEQSGEEQIHVVQAGENLYRIGLQYGVSWTVLAEYNSLANANDIEVGQQIRIPPTDGAQGTEGDATAMPAPQVTHVVQQGETVFIISQQYGVPWPAIAEANDLTSPYTIYAGQTLVIPGGE